MIMQDNEKKPALRFKGFTDPWEQRKVGDHLIPSKLPGHTGVDARKLTVKLWGKGVVEKTDSYGGSEHTQYYVRHAGQFMYGKLDFLHAAFGIVPAELDNYESTLDSPAFDLSEINGKFLVSRVCKEDFYLKYGTIANGSRKAKRIHEDTFMDMPILVPELEEQERVAALLEALDTLITLHQRKYEKLVNIKKSMLDKMFPKNGASVPEIRFKGFTDPWEQRKLGDISEIKTGPFGSTLHADDYVSDGIPIITTEHFKTGSLPIDKCGLPQVSENDFSRLSAYILNAGDIVFSRVGSVDINALITPFQSTWLFSGRVLRVRPQNKNSSQFLHTLLETEDVKNDIRTRAVGQTMPSINTEILKTTPLRLPESTLEQEQLGKYFLNLDTLITLHQRKLEKLQNIKKSCLEKMFV